MLLSAYLGTSGLGNVQFQFYTSSEVAISPAYSGVTDSTVGWYSIANAIIPSNAASVRWISSGTTIEASEYFDPRFPTIPTGSSGAVPVTDSNSRVTSNIASINSDTTSPGNLANTFNGTGYANPNAPAQQQQVANIAVTSAALNTTATGNTITTGTETSGTYASTFTADQVYDQITAATGTIDLYYSFSVGTTGGVGTTVSWLGYLSGSSNSIKVFAYNWGGSSWDQVGTIPGVTSAVESSVEFDLTSSHTGTGGNLGVVRIRFQNTGLTLGVLNTDRLLVGYAVVVTFPPGFLTTTFGTTVSSLIAGAPMDLVPQPNNSAVLVMQSGLATSVNVTNSTSTILSTLEGSLATQVSLNSFASNTYNAFSGLESLFPPNFSGLGIGKTGHIQNVDTTTLTLNVSGVNLDSNGRVLLQSLQYANIQGNLIGSVVGSIGNISGITFPGNFSGLAIGPTGHIQVVDNLITYVGNTPQTGDSYAALNTKLPSNLTFTGANVNANTQATAASLAFNLTGNITGNLAGSVVGSIGNISGTTFPANFNTLGIGNTGHIQNVDTLINPVSVNLSGVSVTVNLSGIALDGNGRVLLQPAQPGVTIPTVTITNSISGVSFPLAKGVGIVGFNDIAPGTQMDLVPQPNASAVTVIQSGISTLSQVNNLQATANTINVNTSNPLTAGEVWANGTRTLTAGTNIVLTKGTGVTGFNDIPAGTPMDLVPQPNHTAVLVIQSGLSTSSQIVTVEGLFPENFSGLGIGPTGHIQNVDTTTNLTNGPTIGSGLAVNANVLTIDGQVLTSKAGQNFNVFFNNAGNTTSEIVDNVGSGGGGSQSGLAVNANVITINGQVLGNEAGRNLNFFFQNNGSPTTQVVDDVGSGGGGGLSGPNSITLTFVDSNNKPVPLVEFSILGQGIARAGTNGVATFGLSSGSYTVTAVAPNSVLFPNTTLIVTGVTSQTIQGTAQQIPGPPSTPSNCLVYGYFLQSNGRPALGVPVTCSLFPQSQFVVLGNNSGLGSGVSILIDKKIQGKSDVTGLVEVQIPRNDFMTPNNLQWQISCPQANLNYTLPLLQSSFNLGTIVI
jgi:hypothetical protein